MSRRPSRPALRFYNSCETFVGLSRRPVMQSLVVSLVLTRLDYGNSTFAGIPGHSLAKLQSVLNAAARLIFMSRKFDHVTPLLRELHWLRFPERIDYKLAVLVFKCLNRLAPMYLAMQRTSSRRGHSHDGICGRRRRRNSLFHEFAVQLSAAVHFPSLQRVSGTVSRLT